MKSTANFRILSALLSRESLLSLIDICQRIIPLGLLLLTHYQLLLLFNINNQIRWLVVDFICDAKVNARINFTPVFVGVVYVYKKDSDQYQAALFIFSRYV